MCQLKDRKSTNQHFKVSSRHLREAGMSRLPQIPISSSTTNNMLIQDKPLNQIYSLICPLRGQWIRSYNKMEIISVFQLPISFLITKTLKLIQLVPEIKVWSNLGILFQNIRTSSIIWFKKSSCVKVLTNLKVKITVIVLEALTTI